MTFSNQVILSGRENWPPNIFHFYKLKEKNKKIVVISRKQKTRTKTSCGLFYEMVTSDACRQRIYSMNSHVLTWVSFLFTHFPFYYDPSFFLLLFSGFVIEETSFVSIVSTLKYRRFASCVNLQKIVVLTAYTTVWSEVVKRRYNMLNLNPIFSKFVKATMLK